MRRPEHDPAPGGNGVGTVQEGGEDGAGADRGPEETAPIGTLFVLMIYLMVLAGMWGTMYWLLVSR